ncbi:MAG: VWA domain-containing protein [Leptospiraceae bacterium]|nr:VWA domain-containing protein [Leptospiraceae bacterium]MCZ8346133.1 VWA domain-containing protein [Leptospiraceae bacterium]
MLEFQRPWVLFAFIPLIGILFFHFRNLVMENTTFPRLKIADDHLTYKRNDQFPLGILIEIFPYIRFLSLGFLILAASGPGSKRNFLPDETQGINIMFALDISGSMVNSRDFLPRNRLEVSINLLNEFILRRVSDRLGLVVFAGAAYLQSPLTNDRIALNEILESIDTETIQEQGTAVGDAILLSTFRLKSAKTKTKIIILLTDGVSNTGRIDPETSAETAKAFGIKIYTIGIGKENEEYEVNFSALQNISNSTFGKFYRAENANELGDVLNEIDNLEKDFLSAKPKQIIETDYIWYLNFALGLMILDLLGRSFLFKFYA